MAFVLCGSTKIASCVPICPTNLIWKLATAWGGNWTFRAEITLVRVEITLVRVEITLCVQKSHYFVLKSHFSC
jgi:hypothetical protein